MNAVARDPLASLILRPGTTADYARVFSDWLRSYADSAWARSLTPMGAWQRGQTARVYWERHHELVERLLDRGGLTVASWSENPWTIVGWALARPGLVHYVYVAEPYRRLGVARRLVEPFVMESVVYSHRSRVCSDLPIPTHWQFDPYAAFLS